MRSKVIFALLLMLSFSVFHDAFLPLLQQHDHLSSMHSHCDNTQQKVCKDGCETPSCTIHHMLHFVAIVPLHIETMLQPVHRETIAQIIASYNPPYQKTSYKPPTA